MPAPRSRPLTDLYVAAARRAVDRPRAWIDVRVFGTKKNADVTAWCLQQGYLRVEPRTGDASIDVGVKRFLATAAPVVPEVTSTPDGWRLRVRHDPAPAPRAPGRLRGKIVFAPDHDAVDDEMGEHFGIAR